MILWEGLITTEQMRVKFEIQFVLHSQGGQIIRLRAMHHPKHTSSGRDGV